MSKAQGLESAILRLADEISELRAELIATRTAARVIAGEWTAIEPSPPRPAAGELQ
jgi:hypothetical protein